MSEREVRASTFKAQCLQMLDDVAEHGHTIIVTKHGHPVAQVVPIDNRPDTIGSVRILADDEEDLFATGEEWDADR